MEGNAARVAHGLPRHARGAEAFGQFLLLLGDLVAELLEHAQRLEARILVSVLGSHAGSTPEGRSGCQRAMDAVRLVGQLSNPEFVAAVQRLLTATATAPTATPEL